MARSPDGQVPADQQVWVAEDPAGVRVGVLWLAHREAGSSHAHAWIYDIEVDEARRGEGWGRTLLARAETETRALGLSSLRLNVFGQNNVARRLYRTQGFTESRITMIKDLGTIPKCPTSTPTSPPRYPGAITVTLALVALVYGISPALLSAATPAWLRLARAWCAKAPPTPMKSTLASGAGGQMASFKPWPQHALDPDPGRRVVAQPLLGGVEIPCRWGDLQRRCQARQHRLQPAPAHP